MYTCVTIYYLILPRVCEYYLNCVFVPPPLPSPTPPAQACVMTVRDYVISNSFVLYWPALCL